MHNKPDGVNHCQHPYPSVELLIPDKQLINVFIDDDVDGIEQRGVLADRADGTVDGHAIIGCVIAEDFGDDIF